MRPEDGEGYDPHQGQVWLDDRWKNIAELTEEERERVRFEMPYQHEVVRDDDVPA